MMPGTCYPGVVYVRGQEKDPEPKKWQGVNLERGGEHRVQIDWNAARLPMGFGDKGRKWTDFQTRDLDRLRRLGKESWTHALAGIACSGATPMVSARSPYNMAKALCCRVFRETTEREWGRGPKPGVWDRMAEFVPELLPGFEAEEMTFNDWLATMPSRRKKALTTAYQRLQAEGWKKGMAEFNAFVKTEILPGFAKHKGELVELVAMTDRLIQGPCDVTHCIAGPVLKPLVMALKRIWHADNAIFYGSANPEKLHHFLQKLADGPGLYFWCDFSMFDNTHSSDSWKFIESLYKSDNPLFWRVLDAWRAPKGRIGPLRYKAPVMNASGRDDTALANGILNGFATFVSVTAAYLCKRVGDVTLEDLRLMRTKCLLSVCGDDSIGKLPLMAEEEHQRFRKAMAENIAEFGFEAKLETSHRLIDAVYLGMRPYPTTTGWYWGKTIGRAAYKMGWATDPAKRDLLAHITGLADMHVKCSSHVPVLADLAKRIQELREGAKRTPVRHDPNRPWEWTLASGAGYDEVTLRAVAEVYAVTTADIKSLITAIRGVERLPAVLDHWLLRHMIAVDDL